MWNRPQIVIRPLASMLWHIGVTERIWKKPLRQVGVGAASEPNQQMLFVLCNEIKNSLQQCVYNIQQKSRNPYVNPNAVPEAFIAATRKTWTNAITALESTKAYNCIPGLYNASIDRTFLQPSENWTFMTAFAMHMLMGDEKRVLAGTRNGPAWKRLAHPITDEKKLIDYMEKADSGGLLGYLDASDTHLLPDYSTNESWRRKSIYEFPELRSPQPIQELLETAYYNQRYLPNPEGSEILLRNGHSAILGMTLKVKPGLNDPNYLDFLARFHLIDGDCLIILDGTGGTGQLQFSESLFGKSIEGGFLMLVMAQTYHDLVTAKKLSKLKETHRTPTKQKGASGIGRYIPRVYYEEYQEKAVRRELDVPRVSEPHHVSGYPRRGRMSEEQRRFILDFERETGFSVLKHLPEEPESTWVRPHMSPKSSSEEIQRLPKFVRQRIQRDIIARMATVREEH